jgi:thioredoxin:protein disulfide reductase
MEMKSALRRLLPAALIVTLTALNPAANAALLPGFGFGMPDQHGELVTMTLSVEKAEYEPGEQVQGEVEVRIDPEWHINSARPIEDFAIPTKLTLSSPALENVEITYPQHIEKAFEFAGGGTLAVYYGTIRIPFRAVRTGSADRSVTASLRYQACNDNVCLPPRDLTMSQQLGDRLMSAEAGSGSGFVPLSEAPANGGSTSLFGGDLQSTLLARGLPLTLLVIFVLGLALNLTPCIYPLIPITLAFFTSQAAGKRSTRAGLAAIYVLGIAITYSALGVFSAITGRIFGSWLQHGFVLVFFALLMVVLASSMFGLFDIRVPGFIANRAGARGGLFGALTMGLLAGVVAAPCVGPFIISLIALVSQLGSIGLGSLMFFVLALGLGLPYLFLGIFSSSVTSIPRSGPWLVQIKKAIGFVLIAVAFYFLRPLTGDDIYYWGVALSLISGAIFLVARPVMGGGKTVQYITAVLLLTAGLYTILSRNTDPSIEWVPYDEQLLSVALAEGRPVIIDFFADWCAPCKELDARTFRHAEVRAESERFVRMKADLTRTAAPETQVLTDRFRIVGVPTVVLLDSSGSEVEPLRLTGFEDGDRFLQRLLKVQ